MTTVIDDNLFPVPSRHGAPNRDLVLPKSRPGVSVASTTTLREVLTDNHTRWHIFFNDKGFHNHTAHAALTLWALGADPAIVKASYEENSSYQRPAFESPGPITITTWKDHLGDETYYQAYLRFFEAELKTKSFSKMFDEYIFSPDANYIKGAERQPEMATRFLEGLLHPMIHIGFGVEFTLPGIFAEGFAQTVVHKSTSSKVAPSRWFELPSAGLVSRFTEVVGFTNKGSTPDIHAFSILARVLKDPELGGFKKPPPQVNFFPELIETYGDAIVKYVDQWTLDGNLEKKVQELLWVNTLLYGVGGAVNKEQFNADFFLMHIVTSSLFLSEVFAEVPRYSQVALLRSYFAACLGWFIGRGRPQLDIAGFFSDPDTARPSAPGPHPTPHEGVNPSPSAPEAVTPNGWLPIIQSTLAHPDDHLPKLQRSLSEYAIHFGLTPAGTFKNTELKDAELIDGTLFIRAAGLTLSRLGWVREGQAPGAWDMSGFFDLPSKL